MKSSGMKTRRLPSLAGQAVLPCALAFSLVACSKTPVGKAPVVAEGKPVAEPERQSSEAAPESTPDPWSEPYEFDFPQDDELREHLRNRAEWGEPVSGVQAKLVLTEEGLCLEVKNVGEDVFAAFPGLYNGHNIFVETYDEVEKLLTGRKPFVGVSWGSYDCAPLGPGESVRFGPIENFGLPERARYVVASWWNGLLGTRLAKKVVTSCLRLPDERP